MLSHKDIFNLPDTENTEHEVRDLLGPSEHANKKKKKKNRANIEHHEIKSYQK